MANAMSDSSLVNPNATLVKTRIFLCVDSMSPFDEP